MTYFHPAAVEHRRKLYTRQDAWRLAPPGTPEAKMPGWLDPSATRVRLKEAQEEEARTAFEAELAELRASHERAKEELAEISYELVLRRLCRKYGYNPDQPRDDHGRWTSGASAAAVDSADGDAVTTSTDVQVAQLDGSGDTLSDASRTPFSPDRLGWHDYSAGPNLVCRAELQCSREEMADQLARFSVPGRDPSNPVAHGDISLVLDPRTGVPGGWVRTTFQNDGLTAINRTTVLHALYDGEVVRRVAQDENGAWYVTTRGLGNNLVPGANLFNQEQGPLTFDILDQRMRDNIERHHAKGILALPMRGLDGGRVYGRAGVLAGGHHV